MICGGESGWKYRMRRGIKSEHDVPLLIADGQGKAQGVSIEKGLQVHNVLGRMIVIQQIEIVESEEKGVVIEKVARRGRPILGVIGCQCVKQ